MSEKAKWTPDDVKALIPVAGDRGARAVAAAERGVADTAAGAANPENLLYAATPELAPGFMAAMAAHGAAQTVGGVKKIVEGKPGGGEEATGGVLSLGLAGLPAVWPKGPAGMTAEQAAANRAATLASLPSGFVQRAANVAPREASIIGSENEITGRQPQKPVLAKIDNLQAAIDDLKASLAANQILPREAPGALESSKVGDLQDLAKDMETALNGNQVQAPVPAQISQPVNMTADAGLFPAEPQPAQAKAEIPQEGPDSLIVKDSSGSEQFQPPPEPEEFPPSQANIISVNPGGKRNGLNAQWVQSNLGDLQASLAGAPPLKIVQSVKDLPEFERKHVENAAAQGTVVGGLFSDGIAYLIADHLSDLNTARKVYLEETLGHAGMAPMVKPGEVDRLYQLIQKGAPEEAAKIARNYNHDLTTPEGRAEFVGEFVAKASRWHLQHPGLWRQIGDFLYSIAYRAGWLDNILPSQLLDAQMRGLARRAAMRLRAQPGSAAQHTQDAASTASPDSNTPPQFSLEGDGGANGQKTGGLDHDATQSGVNDYQRRQKNVPKVQIVNDPTWTHNGYGIRGTVQDGKILVNRAFVDNADTLQKVLGEEHNHALLSSKEGRAFIRKAAGSNLGDDQYSTLAKQYPRQQAEAVADWQARLADEFIAKTASEDIPVWRQIVERVKTWLAGKGIGRLSDEETARAIMRALKSGKTADEFAPRLMDSSRGRDDFGLWQNDNSDFGDSEQEEFPAISRYNLTKHRVLKRVPIEQFETLPYGQFRKFPRDRLAGHELLQNAWLRKNGYRGPVFSQNPAMALPQKFHARYVTPMQSKFGLHRRVNLANMTAEQNILFNAEILRRLNIPHAAIEQAVNASLQYAKTLSKLGR